MALIITGFAFIMKSQPPRACTTTLARSVWGRLAFTVGHKDYGSETPLCLGGPVSAPSALGDLEELPEYLGKVFDLKVSLHFCLLVGACEQAEYAAAWEAKSFNSILKKQIIPRGLWSKKALPELCV